jgi:hypothetical protein
MAAAESSHTRGVSRIVKEGGRVLEFVPREPSIVLSQEEAVQFLLRSATEYEITFCTNPGCEVCHAFVSTWESVLASLSERYRRVVLDKLDLGVVLRPEAPEARP